MPIENKLKFKNINSLVGEIDEEYNRKKDYTLPTKISLFANSSWAISQKLDRG